MSRAETTSSALYLECLQDFERYAETVWSDASQPGVPPDAGYWGDGASGGNGGIRGSCGVAVSYAVLVRALPDDPKRAHRLDRVRQALNYAAGSHVSGGKVCVDGKHWGHNWQSALWASSMGLACLLVQDDLPSATVAAVKRAVADEATYRAAIPPASGYRGDSKAEENAWNSNILALGAAWMKDEPNAPVWLEAAKRYLANTYTVPNAQDDPLTNWITTTTLFPSFAMENHGFYHPSYQMVAGMSLGDSLMMARLADDQIAHELAPFAEHNVLNVWRHLSHMLLDSGEFAYPSGLDWALHDYEQNSYLAWLATHFNDSLARWADSRIAALARHRQQVNRDGRFVGESVPNGFYREAVEARRTAIAWLHHALADYPEGPSRAPTDYVSHFPDIGLISQRGPAGFISISYGDRIMGLVMPPAAVFPNVYLVTPRFPGLIGLGSLGTPKKARLLNFSTNMSGFEAELNIEHGNGANTRVKVNSTGTSVALVELPQAKAALTHSGAGSFSVGIENDPLTGGTRLLQWDDQSLLIRERSGVTQAITNHWLCVAGRLGVVAGPSGHFRYQTASGYNRKGAAEDTLSFVTTDPLAPRFAVWFPGCDAAETALNSEQVAWQRSDTEVQLVFPGGAGEQQIISMGLEHTSGSRGF